MQFIVYQDKYDVEVEWVFHLISIVITDNDRCSGLLSFFVTVIYHRHYHQKGQY